MRKQEDSISKGRGKRKARAWNVRRNCERQVKILAVALGRMVRPEKKGGFAETAVDSSVVVYYINV